MVIAVIAGSIGLGFRDAACWGEGLVDVDAFKAADGDEVDDL